MKTIRGSLPILVSVCFAIVPGIARAQAGAPSTPPAGVPLRPVVAEGVAQPVPPVFKIPARWDERTQVHAVPLRNDTDTAWEVLGVQTSSGIFILDFPQKVGARQEKNLSFIYQAADNSDGDHDLIRVMTDHGIKEMPVQVVREEAVSFATRELRWMTGGPADTQSVLLTLTPGTATPVRVRTTGGHQVALEQVDVTHWKVNVTPLSVAKSGRFAVFVDFDKPLLGKAPIILGVIQSKE